MRKSQRGFVPLFVILFTVAAIAVGFYVLNKNSQPLPSKVSVPSASPAESNSKYTVSKEDITPQAEKLKNSDWLKYTDAKIGFTINLPKGYKILRSSYVPDNGRKGRYYIEGEAGQVYLMIRPSIGDVLKCSTYVKNGRLIPGAKDEEFDKEISDIASVRINGKQNYLCLVPGIETIKNDYISYIDDPDFDKDLVVSITPKNQSEDNKKLLIEIVNTFFAVK